MLSKNFLILASFTIVVAIVSGKPYSNYDSDELDWFDQRVDDDYLSWFGDKHDNYYDHDEDSNKFHFFLRIIKALRNKEDDVKSVNRLFKGFLTTCLQKRYRKHSGDFDLRNVYSDDHDDWSSDDWEDVFDNDEFDYKFDNDIKEEKAKKLFMLNLKFKAHYVAQGEIEHSRRNKEEKARRQFSLFTELVAFTEKVKYHKEPVEKFSKFVDLKLKGKFVEFKKCFFHEDCSKYDDKDLEVYREGELKVFLNMEGGDAYDLEGKHFELFLRLYKFVKVASNRRDIHDDDDDSFFGVDCRNDDDDDDCRNRHPIFRFITYLHKHLADHNPKEYRDRNEHDSDEVKEKFLFFALKAYHELKEEKTMKEKKEKLESIFTHFLKYIKHEEDSVKTREDFGQFRKWHEVKGNKDKLEEFAGFLKRISQVRKYSDDRHDRSGYKDKFERVWGHRKQDRSDEDSDEDYFDNILPRYPYRRDDSRYDIDW